MGTEGRPGDAGARAIDRLAGGWDASAAIYPLTFEPVFRDYIWGGRRLATLFGRDLPPGVVAESWEISGHPDSPTRVAAGAWQGRTLPEVMAALGVDLVGARNAAALARGRFPLLIKLLDANQDLSVQVHPDDAYAAAHEGGESGKAEMWYVLHAPPGYELIRGLTPGVTRAAFRDALLRGDIDPLLHRIPAAAGDAIEVASGTVHAILAGAVVAEIQQTSDVTYRVYDWGRVGDDGRPRPLHVDRALDVINFGAPLGGAVMPRVLQRARTGSRELLVSRPQFTTERITLAPGAAYDGRCDGATFEIWGCVSGAATLEAPVGAAPGGVSLPAVRFVLLPAALGAFAMRSAEGATLLRVFV